MDSMIGSSPCAEAPMYFNPTNSVVALWFLELVKLIVVVSGFLGLILVDSWRAFKQQALWIPPGALVLSALSLQMLSILDDSNVSIGDYPENKAYDLEVLAKKNFLVDGGRVIVCTYMAYLLSSMACSEVSASVLWGDIGALAISLFSHISSELYVFKEFYRQFCINPLSVVFRLWVLLCTILLFLLLASAVFAGRTLYNMVVEKIPLALSTQVITEEESIPISVLTEKLKIIKHDVLQSWLVVWVSKPDYVIARSALSSAVGVVVTICVMFYVAEWMTEHYAYTHFNDGIDWLRYTTTGLECLLIVVGWFIIFWRWRSAIIFFQRQNATHLCHVEDFWTRHLYEMMDKIEFGRRSWEQNVSLGNFLDHLKLKIFSGLFIHKWFLPFLLRLQKFSVWFSKSCCLLSDVIFFVLCIRRPEQNIDEEVKEPLEKLTMPGETAEMLWTASQKAFNETKGFMDKGCDDAIHSKQKLVQLLTKGYSNQSSVGQLFLDSLVQSDGLEVEKDFINLKTLSCKMTVLSLIRVMMKLGATPECLSNVLDAYDEAYEFLDLLDSSVISMLTNAADKEFTLVKREVEGARSAETKKEKEPEQIIMELKDTAESEVKYTKQDSVDWREATAYNSLYKICTVISNDGRILERIDPDCVESLLADIMLIKLMEAGKTLVKCCRDWAKGMEMGLQ